MKAALLLTFLLCCSAAPAGALVFSGAMDNRVGFPLVPGLTAQSRAWIAGGDPAGGVRLEWRVDNESNAPSWTYSYKLVRNANKNKGFAFFDFETADDFTADDIRARQVVSATDPSGATITTGLAGVVIGDPVVFDAAHDFSQAALTETLSTTVLSKSDLSHYSGDPGRVAPGVAGGSFSATSSVGPVPHPFRGIRVSFPGSFATLDRLGYEAVEWEVRIVADRVPMWGDVFAWGDQTTLSPFWYSNFYSNHIDDAGRLTLAPADSLTGADPYQGWVLVPGPLPALSASNPAAGAAAVPGGEPVAATFAGLMDPASITPATFTLARGNNPVPGTVSYDQGSKTATLTPVAPLVPADYTATLSGVKDLAGNLMPDASWSFTVTGVDGVAPTVSAVYPNDGARFVATGTPFRVAFSEEIAPGTLNAASFTVSGPAGALAGAVSFDPATRTASFIPAQPLAHNSLYTATLAATVSDLSGNPLGTPFSWQVSTIPAETVYPMVASTVPARGASNVAPDTPIQVLFSEALDPATVNGSSVTLTSGSGAVAGTVSYDPGTLTASFTPAGRLANGTGYSLTVTTEVQDLAGNPLPLLARVAFSTAAADTVPPAVSAVSPGDGARNQPLAVQISAAFTEALDPLTVSVATFSVSGRRYQVEAPFAVAGSVALVAGGLSLPSAVFTPSAPLAPGTRYTATLSGVKDRAGNALAAPRVWSFVTAPDGILVPGASAPGIADALKALRLAVGLDQPSQDDFAHGDVAPLGADGLPRPDGSISVADALVILRRAVGLITF